MTHQPEAQRNGVITLVLFLSALSVVLILIVGNNYFERVRFEKIALTLAAENPALRDLRTMESTALGAYAWRNREAGVVQIPIERAMELVAGEDLRRRAPAPRPPGSPDGSR